MTIWRRTTRTGALEALDGWLAARSERTHFILEWSQRNGLFFALLALFALFAGLSSRFATGANLSVILLQVSAVAVIAVPGAMLLLAGYVDLSVGSVAVLSVVVFGELASDGVSVWLALAVGLITGTAYGAFNGVLISFLGLSPIVVTLGGIAGARGLAELISGAVTKHGFGDGFASLGNGVAAGVRIPIWIAAGAFLAGAYVWYVAPYGRHLTAIGAAREAAKALGIATRRLPFVVYVASGAAAAVGGMLLASQLDSASLTIGAGLEIDVLTAILLGGVSFMGGRGSLFGVLMGVLFIGVLDNGLVLINISPYVEGVAIGAALVIAAGLDVLYQRLDRLEVGKRTA